MFYLHFHIFYNIFWTNLLTQCPVPVYVCFVCALQKKAKIEDARKIPKKIQKFFLSRRHHKARKRVEEGPPGGQAPWWPARPLAVPPGRLGGGGDLLASTLAYIYPSDQKYPRRSPFLETYLCSTAIAIFILGRDRRTYSGTSSSSYYQGPMVQGGTTNTSSGRQPR